MGGSIPGPVGYGSQEPTLRGDSRRMLPRERLEWTRYGMWGRKFDGMSRAERGTWYMEKLRKYFSQIKESASQNGIPVQLLAAVLLNELADIDARDILQQQLISQLGSGSLGMAQIQVKTALNHDLLAGYLSGGRGPGRANAAARLLAVPQYSIEACAREIKRLLAALGARRDQAWPSACGFAPPPEVAADPQAYYQPGAIGSADTTPNAEDREACLAKLVAAAYNFGERILDLSDPAREAEGSVTHGRNADLIARDLYVLGLFH